MFLAVTEEALAREPWAALIGLALIIVVAVFISTVQWLCRWVLRRQPREPRG